MSKRKKLNCNDCKACNFKEGARHTCPLGYKLEVYRVPFIANGKLCHHIKQKPAEWCPKPTSYRALEEVVKKKKEEISSRASMSCES